jgi:hypothetical protein
MSEVQLNVIFLLLPLMNLLVRQPYIEPHLFTCNGRETLQNPNTLGKKVGAPIICSYCLDAQL